MKTTGEKIRDLRLNLGLTQAELAEMTGITVRSITNYETDAATPRRLQLRKLCEALNTTEDYLLKPEIDDPAYGLDQVQHLVCSAVSRGHLQGQPQQAESAVPRCL